MSKILISAFADEYNRDIDRQIRMAREANLAYLEPRFINEKNIADLTQEEAQILKNKLDGIKISSIGSPLGKINLADEFDTHLETAKRVFETAGILETKNVRMFSFYLHQGKTRQECRAEVLDKLGQMLNLAEKHGVVLCHENEANIYGESPEDCLDILETFEGRMRCVFDMGNFVLEGYKPYPDAYEKLKNYIEYFHIKDAFAQGAIVPPGCGEGAIEDILRSFVKEFDRNVIVTLEPHLQTFDGLSSLTDKTFDTPYVYESKEIAFIDALEKLRDITGKIG